MRLATKILLLMLLITIGSSAIITWLLTMRVTKYETQRANDQISLAIDRYHKQLDLRYLVVSVKVRTILEDSEPRSYLQRADDPAGIAARAQLREEVIGNTLESELESLGEKPAFHVLVNMSHEVLLVRSTSADQALEKAVNADAGNWPVDEVIAAKSHLMRYEALNGKLYLTMGIPVREQLAELPTHAYFVGFLIDDAWVTGQLVGEHLAGDSTIVPLAAWFVVNGATVAKGSSNAADSNAFEFDPAGKVGEISFVSAGERFVGQASDLGLEQGSGKLVLASSLDDALAPLRALYRSIFWTTLIACVAGVIACRLISWMIARPVRELVEGTQRIAAGQFDAPVTVRRRDELGKLAISFNEMSRGLKDREELLHEKVKTQRDLAVAREIQTAGLPKEIPKCPGYEIAAMSAPAEETGGDMYDVIAARDLSGDGQPKPIIFLLADATGHGIGSALSVTQMRAMLRLGLRIGAELDEVLVQINRQLFADLGSSRFVTAFLGMLDPLTNRLTYHSAGQAPLLHFHARDASMQWLETSMPPLGVLEESISDGARHIDLEVGDFVVLLTDGFYEYPDSAGKLFGEEGVAHVVTKFRDRTAHELLEEMMRNTRHFGAGHAQLDDMTGIVIRRVS
jgi:serine phosphatase RsbU (regulator of sigma subunit)